MVNRKYGKYWLLGLFATETLGITYGLKLFPGNPIGTILYFAAGIGLGILLLFFPRLALFPPRSGRLDFPVIHRLFYSEFAFQKWIVACLAALVMYNLTVYWLEDIPIDTSYADMLPIIKVMDQRFVAGHWKQVYDPIAGIWGGVRPIYLPAMWLPYTPAVIMNVDIRWITTAGLFVSFCTFLFVYRPADRPGTDAWSSGIKKGSFFLAAIAFLLFWWLFTEDMPTFISMSEEGVVVCWYSLLVLALLSGNAVLEGIAVSLCLLSRYALIGWVPAYLLYLLLSRRIKKVLFFCVTGFVCLLVFFILPFGWHAFTGLLSLPGNYVDFAKTTWARSPEVFTKGPGFAKFFGPASAGLLHTLLVLLSFAVPVALVGYACYRNRKKADRFSNIPIAALKTGVVVFYNFIDVPYLYLFYTSSFMSLVLVAVALRTPDDRPNERPGERPAMVSGKEARS